MGLRRRDGAPRALRLTFAYEGEEVRLQNRRPVEMIAPPGDELSGSEQGFWIEVRDEKDDTLHRLVMQDPLSRDVEVFSPDAGAVRVPGAGGEALGTLRRGGTRPRRGRPRGPDEQRGA